MQPWEHAVIGSGTVPQAERGKAEFRTFFVVSRYGTANPFWYWGEAKEERKTPLPCARRRHRETHLLRAERNWYV